VKPQTVSDALSRVSGISKADIQGIWEAVKANNAKLDACVGPHKFTIPSGRREYMDDIICEFCGGKISASGKSWYEKGLEHGKKMHDG